jgi:hypothetical protein
MRAESNFSNTYNLGVEKGLALYLTVVCSNLKIYKGRKWELKSEVESSREEWRVEERRGRGWLGYSRYRLRKQGK